MNRTIQRVALGVAATAAVVGPTVAISTPAQAIYIPCKDGRACLNHYTQQVTPSTGKDVDYTASGTYNLSNQTGIVQWCNELSHTGSFRLYSGYGGTGTLLKSIPYDSCVKYNSTPVNSVVVKRT